MRKKGRTWTKQLVTTHLTQNELTLLSTKQKLQKCQDHKKLLKWPISKPYRPSEKGFSYLNFMMI